MLATEDDCSSRSNSENRESIDGAIHAYRRKTRFSTEGLEDIPGPRLCSFYTRRISWVAEDELQEEDHLGEQSVARIIIIIPGKMVAWGMRLPGEWRY